MNEPNPEYISCQEVKRRLHCAAQHVHKLADAGRIGTRKLPGFAQTRYNAADVDRIAKMAITPARPVETPTTPKPSKRRRADSMTG
jgi:hypothetical protein